MRLSINASTGTLLTYDIHVQEIQMVSQWLHNCLNAPSPCLPGFYFPAGYSPYMEYEPDADGLS